MGSLSATILNYKRGPMSSTLVMVPFGRLVLTVAHIQIRGQGTFAIMAPRKH